MDEDDDFEDLKRGSPRWDVPTAQPKRRRRRGLAGLFQRTKNWIAPAAALASGGLPALLPLLAGGTGGRTRKPTVREVVPEGGGPRHKALDRRYDPETGRRRRRGLTTVGTPGTIQGAQHGLSTPQSENVPMVVGDTSLQTTGNGGGNVLDGVSDFLNAVNPYYRAARAAWNLGRGIRRFAGWDKQPVGEERDVYNQIVPSDKRVSQYNGWIGSEPSVTEVRVVRNRTQRPKQSKSNRNVKRRRLDRTGRGVTRRK